ncbi:MAG: hypothetical protein ACRCT1_12540, partial [Microcoleaceae cyanobacterium]
IWEWVGGDGAGLEACLFGGTEVGERAPTELIGWDGVFCPNRLGGCYKLSLFSYLCAFVPLW